MEDQKKTLLDNLASWHRGMPESEMNGCAWGRGLWADMITNASWHELFLADWCQL